MPGKKYKIFMAIGAKSTPTDKNKMWLHNLYEPVVALGHDVFLFDTDEFAEKNGFEHMGAQAREALSNQLPAIFKAEHQKHNFDLAFTYLHNGQIKPEALKEISNLVYTVNYSTNYHQFDMYKEVALNVNLNIYASKVAVQGYDALGVKSYWMPFAGNPNLFKPVSKRNNDTVFVGAPYGNRSYLFWRVLQYGINLHLYGKGWKQNADSFNVAHANSELVNLIKRKVASYLKKGDTAFVNDIINSDIKKFYADSNTRILQKLNIDFAPNIHGPLNDAEYANVLSNAGIVFNIAESRFNHDYLNNNVLYSNNLRDFEATVAGSCLCTQYSDDIVELFIEDKEAIIYHNEHDAADKLKYYSKNIQQRDAVALAGYNRTMAEHTWEKRFDKFFSTLQL